MFHNGQFIAGLSSCICPFRAKLFIERIPVAKTKTANRHLVFAGMYVKIFFMD